VSTLRRSAVTGDAQQRAKPDCEDRM